MGSHPNGESFILDADSAASATNPSSARNSSNPINPSTPTHPPNTALRQRQTLREYIEHAEMCGVPGVPGAGVLRFRERSHSTRPLPFMLKVLAVRLPLSVQIHPDKVVPFLHPPC